MSIIPFFKIQFSEPKIQRVLSPCHLFIVCRHDSMKIKQFCSNYFDFKEKNVKFWKWFFLRLFIIISIKIKIRNPLPVWKGLSTLNMHISIRNESLQNWRFNTSEYQCIFFLLRLYLFEAGSPRLWHDF